MNNDLRKNSLTSKSISSENSNKGAFIGEFTNEFLKLVDIEIFKFYQQFYEMERELKILVESNLQQSNFSKNLNFLFLRLDQIQNLALKTLDLCYFVNLNVTGVRKILKKFDKQLQNAKNPVSFYYLNKHLKRNGSNLVYILQFKIIDETSALIENMAKELEDNFSYLKNKKDLINSLSEPLLLKNLNLESYSHIDSSEIVKLVKSKINQIKEQVEQIDNANNSIRVGVQDWSLIIKNHTKIVDDFYAKTPGSGNRRRRTLKDDNDIKEFQKDLLLQKLTPHLKQEMKMDSQVRINVWIALTHTFIYTSNCYIVLPTNSKYIEELGASPFLSGLILGMIPLAAIFCTFFYSYWTNNSYKMPLIFSCISFIVGNLLYSLADNYMSFFIMGLGRFLCGVGSARVVNRRYLIEEVPKELLMHFSITYVVLTCLGMATGNLKI